MRSLLFGSLDTMEQKTFISTAELSDEVRFPLLLP